MRSHTTHSNNLKFFALDIFWRIIFVWPSLGRGEEVSTSRRRWWSCWSSLRLEAETVLHPWSWTCSLPWKGRPWNRTPARHRAVGCAGLPLVPPWWRAVDTAPGHTLTLFCRQLGNGAGRPQSLRSVRNRACFSGAFHSHINQVFFWNGENFTLNLS